MDTSCRGDGRPRTIGSSHNRARSKDGRAARRGIGRRGAGLREHLRGHELALELLVVRLRLFERLTLPRHWHQSECTVGTWVGATVGRGGGKTSRADRSSRFRATCARPRGGPSRGGAGRPLVRGSVNGSKGRGRSGVEWLQGQVSVGRGMAPRSGVGEHRGHELRAHHARRAAAAPGRRRARRQAPPRASPGRRAGLVYYGTQRPHFLLQRLVRLRVPAPASAARANPLRGLAREQQARGPSSSIPFEPFEPFCSSRSPRHGNGRAASGQGAGPVGSPAGAPRRRPRHPVATFRVSIEQFHAEHVRFGVIG